MFCFLKFIVACHSSQLPEHKKGLFCNIYLNLDTICIIAQVLITNTLEEKYDDICPPNQHLTCLSSLLHQHYHHLRTTHYHPLLPLTHHHHSSPPNPHHLLSPTHLHFTQPYPHCHLKHTHLQPQTTLSLSSPHTSQLSSPPDYSCHLMCKHHHNFTPYHHRPPLISQNFSNIIISSKPPHHHHDLTPPHYQRHLSYTHLHYLTSHIHY